MAAVTYQCKECGANLKSPQALPAGKKIRCPKCNQVFTIGEASTAPAPKPAASPAPKAPVASKAKPALDDDDDGSVSYGFVQETFAAAPTDAELSRTKKKRSEDDDDDDELDDDDADEKPAKKKKKGGFKKKKKPAGSGSGKTIALILAGVALILLLAGGGIGAYLYFNWYKNKGTGKEDPLALLPSDCKLLFHFNFGVISEKPGGTELVDKILGDETHQIFQNIKNETGLDPKELQDNTFAGFVPPSKPGEKPVSFFVFKSRVPFDQNKMRLAFKDADPEHVGWKTYYFKLKNEKEFEWAYMPSDRVLVLTNASEPVLQSVIIANHTQPTVSSELLALAQNFDQDDAWMAGFANDILRLFAGGPGAFPPNMNMPADIGGTLAKLKTAGIGGFSGSQVKLVAVADCGNDSTAKHLTDEVGGMWDKEKAMLRLLASSMGKSGSVVVKDLSQTLVFNAKGNLARASAEVSFGALKDLVMEQAQANQAMQQQLGRGQAGNRGRAGGGRRGGRGGP